jgi:hypothetical protein
MRPEMSEVGVHCRTRVGEMAVVTVIEIGWRVTGSSQGAGPEPTGVPSSRSGCFIR